jgi:hypothetical protein
METRERDCPLVVKAARGALLAVTAALALGFPGIASAQARTFTCTTSVGETASHAFTPRTIRRDVDVPAGATCSLYLVTVTGNVTVEGTLTGFGNTFRKNVVVRGGLVFFPICVSLRCAALGRSHVLGNFTASRPGGLTLNAAFDKNVRIEGATGRVDLSFAIVRRDLSVVDSGEVILWDMGFQGVPGIGGNVDLVRNSGRTVVSDVVIGSSLNCEANDIAPALGPRVTARSALGQCSSVPANNAQ